MFRTFTILAAVAALAVSAAPVASAGNSKKPPPRGSIGTSEVFELNTVTKRPRATAFVWLAELSPVKADSMFHGTGGDGARFAKAPPSVNNMFAGDDS